MLRRLAGQPCRRDCSLGLWRLDLCAAGVEQIDGGDGGSRRDEIAEALQVSGGGLLAVERCTVGVVGGVIVRAGVQPRPQRRVALSLRSAPRHVGVIEQADRDPADVARGV